jgi:hypothetical protein
VVVEDRIEKEQKRVGRYGKWSVLGQATSLPCFVSLSAQQPPSPHNNKSQVVKNNRKEIY